MKKAIIDWYSGKHFHPNKVVDVGKKRFGLPQSKVEAAMVHCFYKIQNGKPISDIDIARYVFNVAKDIDSKKYEKRLEILENAEAKIKEVKINMYTSWAFIGIVNLLFWIFILNWSF